MTFLSGVLTGFIFLICLIILLVLFGLPIVLMMKTECFWWSLLYFVIIPLVFGCLATFGTLN